jgi:hypothetical protein
MKNSILLLVVATSFSFISCNSTSFTDPKAVLSNFFDAVAKKDFVTAKKYVTKDSEGVLGMVEMSMQAAPDSSVSMFSKQKVELSDAVIDGDKATVKVTEKESGESNSFLLKKEDGKWKVAFDKTTLMDMAKQKMKEKGFDKPTPEMMDSIKHHQPTKEEMEKLLDSARHSLDKIQKSY